jgi:AcrR family transcriptional regulator
MGIAAAGRGEQPVSRVPETSSRPEPPRDRILTAASELFARHGIRAVGVDAIIAAAGVAKASFYRHFRSKDDLVAAWLRDARARWLDRVRVLSSERATSPSDELLVFFDVVHELVEDPDFYGCAYINTAAELRDAPAVVRRELINFTDEVEAYLEELARRAGLPSPGAVAVQLRFVTAGMFALMNIYGGDAMSAATAREAATAILDAAR